MWSMVKRRLVVGAGEQQRLLLLQPLRLLEVAVARAVAILAGEGGDFPFAAGVALFEVATQSSSTAAQDVVDDGGLLVTEGLLATAGIQPLGMAEYISHAEFGAICFDLDKRLEQH
jgi:hypothetical protein